MKSFEDARRELLDIIRRHPDGWTNYFSTSVGSAILNALASMYVYLDHKLNLLRLDSYLDTAISEDAIYKLASTRGYFLPPLSAGVWSVRLQPESPPAVLSLSKFQEVGEFPNGYKLLAISDVNLTVTDEVVLNFTIGRVFTATNSGYGNLARLTTIEIDIPDRYITDVERLMANSETLVLVTDITYDLPLDKVVLRRIQPHKVYLYTGNGLLGYANPDASWEYKVVTFGTDLVQALDSFTSRKLDNYLSGFRIKEIKLISMPSDYPDYDRVRAIAIYHPIDSRMVTDEDYTATLMRYFSPQLEDVFTETVYVMTLDGERPITNIYALAKESIGGVSTNTGSMYYQLRNDILDFIESRRTLGMPVNLYLMPASGMRLPSTSDIPSPIPADWLPDFYTDDEYIRPLPLKLLIDKNRQDEIVIELSRRLLFKIARKSSYFDLPRILADVSLKLGTPIIDQSPPVFQAFWTRIPKLGWFRAILFYFAYLDGSKTYGDEPDVVVGYLFRPDWAESSSDSNISD